MELTVAERVVLINVLPKEGNFKTLRTIRKLQENLSLSDEEINLYQLVVDGFEYHWKTEDEDGKPIPQVADIEISDLGKELIADIFKELDEQEKLNAKQHYTLYEKFCEGG